MEATAEFGIKPKVNKYAERNCSILIWMDIVWVQLQIMGHIIARLSDLQEKRRAYYRERYGKGVDVWDPAPKGINRA